jgi:hypothetical protein
MCTNLGLCRIDVTLIAVVLLSLLFGQGYLLSCSDGLWNLFQGL